MNTDIKNILEKIISLPIEYTNQNLSPWALIQNSGYIDVYRNIRWEEIKEVLKEHPKYIQKWFEWSEDKPVTEKWFVTKKDSKYIVGFLSSENRKVSYTKIHKFNDIFDACAFYIKQDIGYTIEVVTKAEEKRQQKIEWKKQKNKEREASK